MITDVIVKDAGRKGKGVFALRDFKKGEFIFRRRKGKIISNKDIPTIKIFQRSLKKTGAIYVNWIGEPARYCFHPDAI